MTRPRIHNKRMLAAIHSVIIEHSGNGELADYVVEYISAPSVSDGSESDNAAGIPNSSVPANAQGLIKLNEQQELIIKEWAADSQYGDLWSNDEARDINLRTFARQILSANAQGPMEREAVLIEKAVGGSYVMPDGRKFWVDSPVANEITRRVLEVSLPSVTKEQPANQDL